VSRLDLAIRYQTTVRREFYRALREYREAKIAFAHVKGQRRIRFGPLSQQDELE